MLPVWREVNCSGAPCHEVGEALLGGREEQIMRRLLVRSICYWKHGWPRVATPPATRPFCSRSRCLARGLGGECSECSRLRSQLSLAAVLSC